MEAAVSNRKSKDKFYRKKERANQLLREGEIANTSSSY